MNDVLIKYETDHGEVKLSPSIIRNFLVSGEGSVSDQEVVMFLNLCKYQKLNPFLREAYLIKYGNKPATIVTGKDTFTKRAAKLPAYDGCKAGIYVQKKDGSLDKRTGALMLSGETLVGGWAEVYRKDQKVPVEISVSFEEYVGRKSDGTVNGQWKKMPATMIRKVALVQALREAFPADFQGLYDASEMSHVDSEKLPEETVKTETIQAEVVPDEPEQSETIETEVVPEQTEQPADINAVREEAKAIIKNEAFSQDERSAFYKDLGNMKSITQMVAYRNTWKKRLEEKQKNAA